MGRRALLLLGLLAAILLLLGSASGFADTAWRDVWDSETAGKRLSLQGQARTMILTEDGERHATALIRAANGKLRLDYARDDHHWSLIDDGARLIHLHPKKQTATFRPRTSMATDRALAESNYRARVVGRATIAGRQTQVIEVAPRQGGQVTWRLWLDRATGFPLKRERYNSDGKLTSGTEFTSVQFKATFPPDTFSVPAGWQTREEGADGQKRSLSDLSRELGFPVVAPGYVPPGYVLQGGSTERRGEHQRLTAALRYTDGLRVLTVYERPHSEHKAGEERQAEPDRKPHHRPGEVYDRGGEKVLRRITKSRIIVVVGDLAAPQLTRVAESID